MSDYLIIASLLINVISLIIIFIMYRKIVKTDEKLIIDSISNMIEKSSSNIKSEFITNRDEFNKSSQSIRFELKESIHLFEDSVLKRMAELSNIQSSQLEIFQNQLNNLIKSNDDKISSLIKIIDEKLYQFQLQISSSSKENRDELNNSFKQFSENFSNSIKDFIDSLNLKLSEIVNKQTETTINIENRLEKMRDTIELKLKSIQEDNTQQLEKIRHTVDEKLHITLENRLSESFKIVSERLDKVHKGLGEMQALANGVGDLKKVLSNVKTRGVLGEFQLESILESTLAPNQYAKNVKTKPSKNEIVEFAVKLPSKNDDNKVIWMPIDSKFPIDKYNSLIDAYDTADKALINDELKKLKITIKQFAKDINDKYIESPYTTDFGIMFLPFENLYAEVLRDSELFDLVYRDYKVIITGPTTLSAILNSLQVGFKTLAIEKNSTEIMLTLKAVKTEFEKFGGTLKKAQDKINDANKELDILVGTRSRAIERKLRNVELINDNESRKLLEININDED